MSVSLRSRATASATLCQPPRKVSEPETQVLPFQFDDGTDDNEEIRRRRYSSSCSSSSESDVIARKGLRGGHRRDGRRPHASSHHEKESDWERVSNGVEHSCVSQSDDEEPSKAAEPESPRRIVSRKKTQQSESESEGGREEGDEMRKASSGSSTATTLTRASTPTSSPSTPRTVSPEDLAGLSKLAVFPGSEAQLVQGYVRRAKTLLHSQYHFYINDKLVLMAEKQPKSRTPNYYLFDMTRAASGLSTKLSKKSGNYIGKVRSSFNKKKSVLIGNQSRKTELGAIIFSGNVSSSEPRRVAVVLPPLNNKRQEIDGVAVGDEPDIFSILVEHYKALKKDKQTNKTQHQVQVFENKQPVFENGFYRLNFHGRVSVPSVKNFQLVQTESLCQAAPLVAKTAASTPSSLLVPALREDGPTVYLQFGKVDDNKFHLDFRSPITPIQAFAIALAQFNL